MTHAIYLGNGGVAYVSDEDANLKQYSWTRTDSGHRSYAVRKSSDFFILLHRAVLGDVAGDIDHINHNGLDCRRHNLRAVSRTINNLNRIEVGGAKRRILASGEERFDSRVQVDGISIHLGTYKTFDEAMRWATLNRQRYIRGKSLVAYKREHRWAQPQLIQVTL